LIYRQVFGQRQVGYVFTTPFGQVFGGVKSAVMVVGNKFDGLQVIAYAVEEHYGDIVIGELGNMAGVAVSLATDISMPSTLPLSKCCTMAASLSWSSCVRYISTW